MPTTLDIRMIPRVLAIIAKYGKSATFSASTGTYNPASGNVANTATTYSKKIIPPYAYENKYVDGDIIKQGDMRSGVAASGLEFTPTPGMSVEIDSATWKIIAVSPVYTGELIAMYELQLRK